MNTKPIIEEKVHAGVEVWARNLHDRARAIELRDKIETCIELAEQLYDHEDDFCTIAEAIDKLSLACVCVNEIACPRYYTDCGVFYIDDAGKVQVLL